MLPTYKSKTARSPAQNTLISKTDMGRNEFNSKVYRKTRLHKIVSILIVCLVTISIMDRTYASKDITMHDAPKSTPQIEYTNQSVIVKWNDEERRLPIERWMAALEQLAMRKRNNGTVYTDASGLKRLKNLIGDTSDDECVGGTLTMWIPKVCKASFDDPLKILLTLIAERAEMILFFDRDCDFLYLRFVTRVRVILTTEQIRYAIMKLGKNGKQVIAACFDGKPSAQEEVNLEPLLLLSLWYTESEENGVKLEKIMNQQTAQLVRKTIRKLARAPLEERHERSIVNVNDFLDEMWMELYHLRGKTPPPTEKMNVSLKDELELQAAGWAFRLSGFQVTNEELREKIEIVRKGVIELGTRTEEVQRRVIEKLNETLKEERDEHERLNRMIIEEGQRLQLTIDNTRRQIERELTIKTEKYKEQNKGNSDKLKAIEQAIKGIKQTNMNVNTEAQLINKELQIMRANISSKDTDFAAIRATMGEITQKIDEITQRSMQLRKIVKDPNQFEQHLAQVETRLVRKIENLKQENSREMKIQGSWTEWDHLGKNEFVNNIRVVRSANANASEEKDADHWQENLAKLGIELRTVGELLVFDGEFTHYVAMKPPAIGVKTEEANIRCIKAIEADKQICQIFQSCSRKSKTEQEQELRKELETIRESCEAHKALIKKMNAEVSRELDRLRNELEETVGRYNQTLGRSKRVPLLPIGIIAVGSAMGYGVWRSENNAANTKKVEKEINSLVSSVNAINDTFVASVNQLISLSTKLDTVTKEKASVTEELGKSLNESLTHIETLNTNQVASEKRNWALMHLVTQMVRAILMSSRRRVELLFLTMDTLRYTKLMTHLENGNLPHELMSRADLNEVLNNINRHLEKSRMQVAIAGEDWHLYYSLPLTSAPKETGVRSIKLRIPLKLKERKRHTFTLVEPITKWVPCSDNICKGMPNGTYFRIKLLGLWALNKYNQQKEQTQIKWLAGSVNEKEIQCVGWGILKRCMTLTGITTIKENMCENSLADFKDWHDKCEFETSLRANYEPIQVGIARYLIHKENNKSTMVRIKRKSWDNKWEENEIKSFAETFNIPNGGELSVENKWHRRAPATLSAPSHLEIKRHVSPFTNLEWTNITEMQLGNSTDVPLNNNFTKETKDKVTLTLKRLQFTQEDFSESLSNINEELTRIKRWSVWSANKHENTQQTMGTHVVQLITFMVQVAVCILYLWSAIGEGRIGIFPITYTFVIQGQYAEAAEINQGHVNYVTMVWLQVMFLCILAGAGMVFLFRGFKRTIKINHYKGKWAPPSPNRTYGRYAGKLTFNLDENTWTGMNIQLVTLYYPLKTKLRNDQSSRVESTSQGEQVVRVELEETNLSLTTIRKSGMWYIRVYPMVKVRYLDKNGLVAEFTRAKYGEVDLIPMHELQWVDGLPPHRLYSSWFTRAVTDVVTDPTSLLAERGRQVLRPITRGNRRNRNAVPRFIPLRNKEDAYLREIAGIAELDSLTRSSPRPLRPPPPIVQMIEGE